LTGKRLARIKSAVSHRQKNLTIVLENIINPHNVSAVFRTADAAGIDKIYLIYNQRMDFPDINMATSASAGKWVDFIKFRSAGECFAELHKQEFKIFSTYLSESGKNISLYDTDLTGSTALVFGNEKDGVSQEAKELSDANILIPMYGMIRSLNISVAAGICIYEALRQRQLKGMYDSSMHSEEELNEKLQLYSNK
jgi:tRNA (guanosine-2'-O-)-methyltransferase